MVKTDYVIEEIIEALQAEANEIRSKGGGSTIDLKDGVRKGRTSEFVLYSFRLLDDVYIKDDAPVKLVVGEERIEGFIVSLAEGVLLLGINKDLGEHIPSAQLYSDDASLIEALQKRIEEDKDNNALFNLEMALKTLGIKEKALSDISSKEDLPLDHELNLEQNQLLSKTLTNEIIYLWGPPGTGKTTTLAKLVEVLYQKDLSILLVSNTNIAVDTALEKVCKQLLASADEKFQEGAVVRLGPVVKPGVKEEYGRYIDLDQIVERLGKPLILETEQLNDELNKSKEELAPYEKAIQVHHDFESVRKRSVAAKKAHRDNLEQRKKYEKEMTSIRNRLPQLQNSIQAAEQMTSVGRFFRGINIPTLEKNRRELALKEEKLKGLFEQLIKGSVKLKQNMTQHEKTLSEYEDTIQRQPPLKACKEKKKSLTEHISKIQKKISEIAAELSSLREKVIQNGRIVATTVYRTYLESALKQTFDVVIIDEASMIPLAMSFYVAGKAKKKVVVGGDFRQLPPIVMSREEIVKKWMQRDVFESAEIPKIIKEKSAGTNVIALRSQYRMNSTICEMINTFFYPDNPLKTESKKLSGQIPAFPFGNKALFYVDTSAFLPWASLRMGTYSRYNLLHTIIIEKIVHIFLENKFIESGVDDAERIGIISPYASQAKLIRSVLDEKTKNQLGRYAATVHRFQGNEKDTMIIDVTDSIGVTPSRLIRATSHEDDGGRLLNVALSRARNQIVLVANFSYLSEKLKRDSLMVRILEYFKENGYSIDLPSFLPIASDDILNSVQHASIPAVSLDEGSAHLFNESSFYGAVMADMKKANSHILIFSPFVTERGTARWMDVIQAKLNEGVKVKFVTRPEGGQGGVLERGFSELIQNIRKSGVVMDHRDKMHEKFIIVDNKILWYGSLNMLSHNNTTETMVRIDNNRALCEQLGQLVSTAKPREVKSNGQIVLAQENKTCEVCEIPMTMKSGRYGIYFECESCGEKEDLRGGFRRRKGASATYRGGSRRVSSATAVRARASQQKCPKCSKKMVIRQGPRGRFFGCSNFPQCRGTRAI